MSHKQIQIQIQNLILIFFWQLWGTIRSRIGLLDSPRKTENPSTSWGGGAKRFCKNAYETKRRQGIWFKYVTQHVCHRVLCIHTKEASDKVKAPVEKSELYGWSPWEVFVEIGGNLYDVSVCIYNLPNLNKYLDHFLPFIDALTYLGRHFGGSLMESFPIPRIHVTCNAKFFFNNLMLFLVSSGCYRWHTELYVR